MLQRRRQRAINVKKKGAITGDSSVDNTSKYDGQYQSNRILRRRSVCQQEIDRVGIGYVSLSAEFDIFLKNSKEIFRGDIFDFLSRTGEPRQ